MAISNAPWDGSASRWSDTASYCKSCLIDENEPGTPSDKKVQSKCHLPVYEPGGALNKNGLSAAAGRLMQTQTSPANKKAAARKLKRLYAEAKMDVPDSVKRVAG